MTPVAFDTWLAAGALDPLSLLPVAQDELRALYDALWVADVEPVTLELCRIRIATLIRSRADLAVMSPIDAALVDALPSWPSSPLFTDAQRAALAFTEQYVMDVEGFTDADTDKVKAHYTAPQIATLTIAVATFDALTRVRAMVMA
jgi:alkylhydroperoxidase family enzyme